MSAINSFPRWSSHPIIRQKFVLQIMDGIRGVYHGGPFSRDTASGPGTTTRSCSRPTRWRSTMSNGTLSTPSERSRTCPPVAATGGKAIDPLKTEGFDVRQPQHIALAGALGLGFFDLKSNKGRRFSIQHRIVNV